MSEYIDDAICARRSDDRIRRTGTYAVRSRCRNFIFVQLSDLPVGGVARLRGTSAASLASAAERRGPASRPRGGPPHAAIGTDVDKDADLQLAAQHLQVPA